MLKKDEMYVSGYDWLLPSFSSSDGLYPLGDPSSVFGVVHNANTPYAESEIFFMHKYVLPSNVYPADVENAILAALPDFPSLGKMHAYCRGEWVPHDEECYGTQNEAYKAMGDSVAVCGSLGGITSHSLSLSGKGWCVEGGCDFNICAPYPLNSTPSEPLNACFEKDGRCYKCNSDRGADCGNSWLWSSFHDANVGYWYNEVACNGGSLLGGSDFCSAYPMPTPSNPLDACFEKDGKCYKCNPDRGSDCGNSWLWSSFHDANVGYWYNEVACNDAEEEEFCPRGLLWDDDNNNFLHKKGSNEMAEQYYEFPWRTENYLYDALGRRTYDDRNTRRFLFRKKIPSKNAIEVPFVLRRNEPVTIRGENCGVFGKDYGFVRNGYFRGGFTCSEVDAVLSEEAEEIIVEETFGRCGRGKYTTRLHGIIPAKVSLVKNNIYYVEEGDSIQNLFDVLGISVVDKATEVKMCKHEVGHQRDNARLVQEKIVYISLDVTTCGCKESWAMATNFLNAEREKIRKPYYDLINNATTEYHRIYGDDRSPSDVECPN